MSSQLPLDHLWNLYRLKRYELAEQELGKILQNNPREAESLALLALVVSALGREEDAFVFAVDALALDPENAWYYFILAHINVKHHNVGGAIECLLKAISLSSWSAEYYRFLSQCYSHAQQYEHAHWSILKALELDAEDIESLLQYGIIKYEIRQPEQAAVILKHVLALDPNNALCHQYLGWINLDQFEIRTAHEHFRVSLASQPVENQAEAGLNRAKELDSNLEAKLYLQTERWLDRLEKVKADPLNAQSNQELDVMISRDAAIYTEQPKPVTITETIQYSYEPCDLNTPMDAIFYDYEPSAEKSQWWFLKIFFILLTVALVSYVVFSR